MTRAGVLHYQEDRNWLTPARMHMAYRLQIQVYMGVQLRSSVYVRSLPVRGSMGRVGHSARATRRPSSWSMLNVADAFL